MKRLSVAFRAASVGPFTTALGTAARALVRHPLRASLTGLGIFVGVLAVTSVVMLGEGAERAVEARIDKLGESLVTVRPEAPESSGLPREERAILTELDAERIAAEVRGVDFVAPVLDGLVRARSTGRNATALAVGTTLEYFPARSYRLTAGALWSKQDQLLGARVVVIGPALADELFPGQDPIGESVRIGRHSFRILGVLEEKGQTPFGMDQDNVVVMPIGAMRSKVAAARPGEVGQILLRAHGDVPTVFVKRSTATLLRQLHQLREGQSDDFDVRDQSRIADAQRGIVLVMRTLLLSIAFVSLVIGGIGVMNIMLVSVAERSREIGTRMAVGARPFDILVQFLIESIVLSLLGGGLGAVASMLLVGPLEARFGWDLEVSPRALLLAFCTSMIVGLLFGILPARRAAGIDPVDALRRS